MTAPNSWSRRLTGILGQRLQRWGAALMAWADGVPTLQADSVATTPSGDSPPAHWLAMLAAHEGPVQWFGRNLSDPNQPSPPPPTAPPSLPPIRAPHAVEPTYPGASKRAPLPVVRFEPWPEQPPPAAPAFEPPPAHPTSRAEPGYSTPMPPPAAAPDYVTPPAVPTPPTRWPVDGVVPVAPPAPSYPTLLTTPAAPVASPEAPNAMSVDEQPFSAPPPGAPARRIQDKGRFAGEAALPRLTTPEYTPPVQPAAATPAYAPNPERAPATPPVYRHLTAPAPVPAPAYTPSAPRRAVGSAESLWPLSPPKPAPTATPPTTASPDRQAPQTPLVWPETPAGWVESAWDSPLDNGARWPELPMLDSADNEAPQPADPYWEEFRREQNGARLRRGV